MCVYFFAEFIHLTISLTTSMTFLLFTFMISQSAVIYYTRKKLRTILCDDYTDERQLLTLHALVFYYVRVRENIKVHLFGDSLR